MGSINAQEGGDALRHRNHGAVLPIILATSLFVIAIGIFAIAYAWLVLVDNKNKAATEAAALAAAVKMRSLPPVKTEAGNIGLVDIDPQGGDNPVPGKRVIGYNTAMATWRLDYAIISKVKNRGTLESIAKDEYRALEAVANKLRENAVSTSWQKTLEEAAGQSLEQNINRLTSTVKSVKVDCGGLYRPGTSVEPTGVTNIPVFKGDQYALNRHSSTGGFYNAGVNLGPQNDFFPCQLAWVADQPGLVDASLFGNRGTQSVLPPTVVRVTATIEEKITGSPNSSQKKSLIYVACAQVGGPLTSMPTTVYMLGFPDGMPAGPSEGRNRAGLWNTITNLIAQKSLGFDDTGGQWHYNAEPGSVAGYWAHKLPRRTWFIAPEEGIPGGSPLTRELNKRLGQGCDVPSRALAIGIWDWLRSLGLRPDVESIAKVLETDLYQAAQNAESSVANGLPPGLSLLSSLFCQPVIAASAKSSPLIQAAKVDAPANPDDDPRTKAFLAMTGTSDPGAAMVSQVLSYKPLKKVIPKEAAMLSLNPTKGEASTVDGNSVLFSLESFEDALAGTNHAARVARAAAQNVISSSAPPANSKVSGPWLTPVAAKERAKKVLENAAKVIDATYAIQKDFSTVTRGGVRVIWEEGRPYNTFTVNGGEFRPLNSAGWQQWSYTPQQPIDPEPAYVQWFEHMIWSKGERLAADVLWRYKWDEPIDAVLSQYKALLTEKTSTEREPVILLLNVKGDASKDPDHGGRASITRLTQSPFAKTKTPMSQAYYLAISGFQSYYTDSERPIPLGLKKVLWSAHARDLVSDLGEIKEKELMSSDKDWCHSRSYGQVEGGSSDCPCLAGEFIISTPLFQRDRRPYFIFNSLEETVEAAPKPTSTMP